MKRWRVRRYDRFFPMADSPIDSMPRGRLRALYEWLAGAAPSPHPLRASRALAPREDLPARIGHYAIARKLGEGGMGVVYAARDERLERTVALKTMSSLANDETARKRFWREARAAASVNHPNVCQIYEIGEDAGELFIAMELLEGEALAERLRRGPLSVSETVPIGLGMLAALSALHARGIVHRDLKPSNVFLTPHGVKLLDFGLARPELERSLGAATDADAHRDRDGHAALHGPRTGDGRSRSTPGAISSRRAPSCSRCSRAGRRSAAARSSRSCTPRVHEQPPALTGSPAVAAVDRVIRRALAKRPAERPASADAMAEELRAVRGVDGDDTSALAHALTRLVVLPFRVLRPDPETDFLAFSLPDAIATSLSGIGSLIVRSSATAARFAGEAPDLKALAAEADVDRVVMGTLLRSGEQLRAAGAARRGPGRDAAHIAHGPVVAGRSVPAAGRHRPARGGGAVAAAAGRTASPVDRDAPHNARAYELYLRANELARTYDGLADARDLYQRCLELDPRFAPRGPSSAAATASSASTSTATPDSEARAEEAFRRALELNPRLSVAHKFYANLEADIGQAQRALVRLLGEANRHGNDPELFAGLVHACRYCGLYEQSDRRARRGAPARPEHRHEPRADAADDGRHRPAPGRRRPSRSSPAPTTASG